MAKSGNTRAQENRAIRKEALREQLSNGKHVEHVIEISNKLANLDGILEQADITRLKYAADIKCKLITKYLPDLKAVELTGEDGEAIKTDNKYTVEIVAKNTST